MGRRLDVAREQDLLRVPPGRTLIEGRRPVLEALRAGRTIDRVLVATGTNERGALGDLLSMARVRRVPVETVSRSLLDREASTGAHQGVLAVVSVAASIELSDLLAESLTSTEPPFFLALDGVEDPHNLGALARSADAAGCHGMIVPRRRTAPRSAVAEKAAAGALAHLGVAEVVNLPRGLEQLADAGVWCVGLDGEVEQKLFDLDLADQPVCVVVGGEGSGLSRLVRESCDVLAAIPMAGHVASLNASVAGALALFEVRRRRGAVTRAAQPQPDPAG